MIMLGNLGQLSLFSAFIASSLSSVTGYSVLFGMCNALETLCGPAYGAGQYQNFGTFTYSAIPVDKRLLSTGAFSIFWHIV